MTRMSFRRFVDLISQLFCLTYAPMIPSVSQAMKDVQNESKIIEQEAWRRVRKSRQEEI
jgi:hypothetical protein